MFKNKTKILRSPKDVEHPFTRIDADLFKLDGYELAIMSTLLSNADSFIINQNEIKSRLKFPKKKFYDAWKRLEAKYYIRSERFFGGVYWVIVENPERTQHHTLSTDGQTIQRSENATEHILSNSSLTTDSLTTDGQLTTIKKNYNELKPTQVLSTLEGNTKPKGWEGTFRLSDSENDFKIEDSFNINDNTML